MSLRRATGIGSGLFVSALLFWAIVLGAGAFLFSHLNDREVMHVGSPQQTYYLATVTRLVIAALVPTPVGYWAGTLLAGLLSRSRLAWAVPILAGAGYVLLVASLLYLPIVFGPYFLPGWKSED